MILRSIGKSLRGKATPTQLFLATLLGGMLGFVPGFLLPGDLGGGFAQAPATILGLLFLVLVLNANLALFGLTLAAAKLLALLLMPVSFGVGRWLVDGPLEGLMRWLVNAPVFAWCGFEYYATTGGLVLGAVFGCLAGLGVVRLLKAFRRRMAAIEESSERYQQWSQKGWVRFGTWLLFGKGKGKKLSYQDLAESGGKGLPIRIPGVVAVVVLGVVVWLGHGWLSGPGLRGSVREGLEYWNRATVDLSEASLDLAGGRLTFAGLGMTDLEDLARNAFEARTLDLQVGTGDLLRKRFVVDRIVSREAFTGSERDKPGEIVRPVEDPPPPPPDEDGAWTLDEVVAEAQLWKGRLEQARDWLQYLAGDGDGAPPSDAEVEEQAQVVGLAGIAATHLLDQAPRVLIRELAFDGIVPVGWGGELLDLRATNLSSNPALVDAPMEVALSARSGAFEVVLSLNPAVDSVASIATRIRGIDVDAWMGGLQKAPLRGGTAELSLAGKIDLGRADGVWVELPIAVDLADTIVAIPGLDEAAVERMTLPIGIHGMLTSPSITVHEQALTDALVQAGRAELAAQVRQRADQLGLGDGAGAALGGLIDGTGTIDGVTGEAVQRVEDEVRKQLGDEANKAIDEIGGKLGGQLKGLLGGKDKKKQ